MPDGGSDCCGTCPFLAGGRCALRGLAVDQPFYTYCANHPHHNPAHVRAPVGPVYVHDDATGGRKVWVPSPDTPEIRDAVLALVAAVTPDPVHDYPAGHSLAEAAVIQAGTFRDVRAAPDLERIRQFVGFRDTDDGADGRSPFVRDPGRLAAFAERSLGLLFPLAEVFPFRTAAVRGLADAVDAAADPVALAALADALEEAGCSHDPTLDYLRSSDAADAVRRHPCWVVDAILGRLEV